MKRRIIVLFIVIEFIFMAVIPVVKAVEKAGNTTEMKNTGKAEEVKNKEITKNQQSSKVIENQQDKQSKQNKGDGLKLTFKEAIFLALRNNARIKSAEIARIKQKYAVVVAKHAFQPNYFLQGAYQYSSFTDNKNRQSYKYSTDSFDIQPKISLLSPYGTQFGLSMNNPVVKDDRDRDKDWRYTPSLTFEITQPLIRGFGKGVVEASLNSALDQEEINKLVLKDTVAETINTVISDYINLAYATEALKISQVSLASYQHIVKRARALIKAGRAAKNDIIQVEAQVALQDSMVEHHKNELMQAQGRLLNTLGLDNQTSIQLPEKINYDEIASIFVEKNTLPDIDSCKKVVLTNNIGYQIEGIALRTLGRSLLVAKDNTNWSLDLIAGASRYGKEDHENSNINNLVRNREHGEKIALNLSVPIDDVNAKKAVIDAQVGLEQAKIKYHQLKRQLELDIATMHNAAINAKRQLELSREALKLQQLSVEVAALKYNAGRTSSFELLNNQKDLTIVSSAVIANQVRYINTLATFSRMLGETLDRLGIKLTY